MTQPMPTTRRQHWAQINELSFVAGMRLLFQPVVFWGAGHSASCSTRSCSGTWSPNQRREHRRAIT